MVDKIKMKQKEKVKDKMKKVKKIKGSKNKNKSINWKVVINSLIALVCVGLAVFVDWVFLLGAVIMIYFNQRELMGK